MAVARTSSTPRKLNGIRGHSLGYSQLATVRRVHQSFACSGIRLSTAWRDRRSSDSRYWHGTSGMTSRTTNSGLIFFGQRECIVQNWLGIFGEVDWAEDSTQLAVR